jgi:hypothetical protein
MELNNSDFHSLKFTYIENKYYAGQKILAVIICQFKKKKIVIRTLLSS